jgi:hypothetical protein
MPGGFTQPPGIRFFSLAACQEVDSSLIQKKGSLVFPP